MKPGLRLTLLATLLPLIALPWIGLRFVETFASLARDAQVENLKVATRGLAASLHERGELFGEPSGDEMLPRGVEAIEVATASVPEAQWHPLTIRLHGDAPASTLAVRVAFSRPAEGASVQLLVIADDERFVAPGDLVTDGRGPVVGPGDSLTVSIGGANEWLQALQADRRARATGLSRITPPNWRERIPVALAQTAGGWQTRLDLPADTRLLRIQVDDVDYLGTRRIEAQADSGLMLLTGAGNDDAVAEAASQRERRWAEVLRALERASGRLSIHAADGRLLAQRGSVALDVAPGAGFASALARSLLRLAQPVDESPEVVASTGMSAPLANALAGVASEQSARIPVESGMPAWRLASAHPVWIGRAVAGALVLEESTVDRLAIGQLTLERLTLLVLAACAATVLALAGVSTLLVSRIARLREAAERAIDARGRVIGTVPSFRLRDEVGALAQSHAQVLERLHEHQQYLARLRSRLVHELRTPIMVVRSSLENLVGDPSPEAAARYGARALEGAARLERLVASMSEAGSLEAMLADSELQSIDLHGLCEACVDAWRVAWPAHEWRWDDRRAAGAGPVRVVPDALAQALDKLASNAADFASTGTSIMLEISTAGASRICITMRNQGPALPRSMAASLFESMVSVRPSAAAPDSHLGFGLYLVRLIAEFHGGSVFARDCPGGVEIGFVFEG